MIQRSGIKRKRVCPYIANPYLQHPVQSDIGELIHDSNLFLVKACSDMVLHVSTSSSGEDLSLYTGMIGPLMTIQRLQAEVDACKDIAITKPQRVKGSPKGSKKIGFCSQTTAMDMYQCLVNGEIYDLDPHLYDDDSAMSNELLYGRSGLAYLLEYFKKKGLTCARAGMTQAVLSHVKLTEFPWQWGGKEYFGAAHGTAGILLALKKLNDVVVPDLFDELISKSVLASGNFITSQGSTTDRLVQWCHGSPGFVPLILEYYDTAPERYRPVLENALEVIWHRGFLTKGCGVCHGIAGNGYAFLAAFVKLGEIRFLHQALAFAREVIQRGPGGCCSDADRRFSLFEGVAGAAMFLMDIQKVLQRVEASESVEDIELFDGLGIF